MSQRKKLTAPMWKYPREVTRLALRGIFFGVRAVSIAILFKNIINELVWTKDITIIWMNLLTIILLFGFNNRFRAFFRTLKLQTKQRIQWDLYVTYLWKYLQWDTQFTDQLWTGKANSILQKWCDQRANICEFLLQDIWELFFGLVFWILVIWRSFWVIWITLAIIITIIIIYTSKKGSDSVNKRRIKRREIMTEWDRHVVKIIMSKLEILQQSKLTKEIDLLNKETFEKANNLITEESMGMRMLFDSSHTALTTIRVWLLFYCIWLVLNNNMNIWEMTMIWITGTALNSIIHNIVDRIPNLSQWYIFVQKLQDTFDTMPPLVGYETGELFVLKQWAIDLRNVSFGYYKNNWENEYNGSIFTNFSLTIPAKQKIALVGPSGGGKTTLVKLIAGYLRPTSGQILVDDQDLTTVSLKSYYPHIGYLTQDSSVFDWTIRENLEYGISHQSVISLVPTQSGNEAKQSIDNILKLAQCERVYDLPNGLDTEIGERGIRLSGGQRQRLAIAKLMLKNPSIIILDEPTSALDSENEEAVTESLNALFAWRTVIIIAHRLQTVKTADTIVLIDNGQIAEQWTHTSLMTQKGKYFKMVELQSGF
jgi:ABC-type multidrug transport system fused ATPase/permease subunit